ncbi:MAG: TonB-dependent receptor, partial [Flammeovirgaceae bacterium]|nr:TonB-dependent receptor [Flammeovirgaceae bacterium]
MQDTVNLNEYVVSANRLPEPKNNCTRQIISTNRQRISYLNQQNTADLLFQTGNVFVQKSQQGGGSPMLRGFAANAVLIVVDGVRMNNAIFRSGNLQNVILIDVNALKSAEVVLGAGSVIYGSDALGGVMHFRTKSPEFSENGKPLFFGDVLLRYATANQEQTKHVDFNLGLKKWAFYTSLTHSDFSDLRAGNRRSSDYPDWGKRLWYVERIDGKDVQVTNEKPAIQKFSGYNQWNVMQKVSFKATEYLSFHYALHYTTSSNIPRYDNLQQLRNNKPRFAEWYYGPQKWTMHHFSVEHQQKNFLYDRARITLSYQLVEESRHERRFQQNTRTSQIENVNLTTLNVDVEKILEKHNITLYYGIEAAHNDVKSTAHSRNILTQEVKDAATRYPNNSRMTTAALYSMAQQKLSEKFWLFAGIRYNYYHLYSPFVDKRFFNFPFDEADLKGNSLNGNLGATLFLGKQWQLHGLFSSGFRAPNVDDTGKIFDGSASGVIVVPNVNLQPEKAYNTEVTLSKAFQDKVQFSITAYYTHLQDAMVTKPFKFNGQDSIVFNGQKSAVHAVQNVGRAYVAGIQSLLKIVLTPNLFFQTSYNYGIGKDLT